MTKRQVDQIAERIHGCRKSHTDAEPGFNRPLVAHFCQEARDDVLEFLTLRIFTNERQQLGDASSSTIRRPRVITNGVGLRTDLSSRLMFGLATA